jgi:hypothetical protein
MKRLRYQIGATMALGLVAMLAGTFAHLALTDIYHGETDVTLEWRIVQIASAVIVLFIGAALLTLRKVLRVVV